MSTTTSDPRPGPRPTCRRGVAVFPPAPGAQERANQNDAVALPAADDGFARPVENAATIRSTRICAGGPHPRYVSNSGPAFGLKPVEVYAAQEMNLGGLQSKISASTSDRLALNANLGNGRHYGMGSLRVRPDTVAGMSLLGGAVGGGCNFGGFGRGAADVGFGREHIVTDQGNRLDSDARWHKMADRIPGRGAYVALRRRRSQSSIAPRPSRDVEIKDISSYSLFSMFTPNMPTIIGMLRADAGLTRETRLVLPLGNNRAWDALYKQNGFYEMLRDRCRGAHHQDIKVPTLHEPNHIGIGSKLTVLTIANGQLSTFWGLEAARAGVQRMAQRNVQFAVKRNAVDNVRATYSVMNLSGHRWSAGCVVGLQAMTGNFGVNVWNYDVGFDASVPETEKVYRAFVNGHLPKRSSSALEKSDAPAWKPTIRGRLYGVDLEGVAAFINSFNQQRSGTRYESVRNINANYTRRGVAVRWYLVANYFLWPGQVTALSNELVNTDYEEHGSNGDSTWRIESLAREYVTERLWNGSQVVGTSAMRVWSKNLGVDANLNEKDDDPTKCDEAPTTTPANGHSSTLHINARFYASRTNGKNVNKSFIEPINRALRLKLRTFTYDAVDLERCIEVETSINDNDAIKLSKIKPSRADEYVFASSTGLSIKTIAAFLKGLRRAAGALHGEQLEAVKACVQCFVREHGTSGYGLVHQLLRRKAEDVSVTTMSDHYQAAHKRARTVVFRYRDPLHADMSLNDLRARWLDVRQSIWEIENGINVVRGDELISVLERRSLQNGLEGDLDDLRGVICAPATMKDADKQKLARRLRRAWWRPFTTHAFAHHMQDPTDRHAGLIAQALKVASAAPGQLRADMGLRELRRRFKAAHAMFPKLQAASRASRTESYLYDDEKQIVCERLSAANVQVASALGCSALSREERNKLRATLHGAWWQTSADKAMLQMLDEVDALAPLVAAGRYTHEQVDAVARAFAPTLQRARAVLAKHRGTLQAGMTPAQLRERFGEVEGALRALDEGMTAVEADRSLSPGQRNPAREQMGHAMAGLRSCISLDALSDAQRCDMIAGIEQRFWKTSLDSRIVSYLENIERTANKAQALRSLPALQRTRDTRAYLRCYGRIDRKFDFLLQQLEHDVLRTRHQAAHESQLINDARDRMHTNLWDRRAAVEAPFQMIQKWWYWPSPLSWWTSLGRCVERALNTVPAQYVSPH